MSAADQDAEGHPRLDGYHSDVHRCEDETEFNGNDDGNNDACHHARSHIFPDSHQFEMVDKRCFLRTSRWHIAILLGLAATVSFSIRTNIGVAKTRMLTNFTDTNGQLHPQKFHWSKTELGLIETTLYYGAAVVQLPAGILAWKFPPHIVHGTGILSGSTINIVVVLLLMLHPRFDWLIIVLQFCQGISFGLVFPAMLGVLRKWAPELERSQLVAIASAGTNMGIIVGLPLSGVLVASLDWWVPFLVCGSLGIVWATVWFSYASSTPASNRWISEAEKRFLERTVPDLTSSTQMTLSSIPWRHILTCVPNWAICACIFARNWMTFTFLVHQVAYFKDVLGVDIHKGGFLSSLPQIATFVCLLAAGRLADKILSTGKVSAVVIRKSFICLSYFMEGICYVLLAYTTRVEYAVLLLTVAGCMGGISTAAVTVNFYDISPAYVSVLVGFANSVSLLSAVGSFVAEHLTFGNPSGWYYVFMIAALVIWLVMVVYFWFGSADQATWAVATTTTTITTPHDGDQAKMTKPSTIISLGERCLSHEQELAPHRRPLIDQSRRADSRLE